MVISSCVCVGSIPSAMQVIQSIGDSKSTHAVTKGLKYLISRIKEFCQRLFALLKLIVYCPVNCLGSKTWSLPGVLFRFPKVAFRHIFHSKTVKHSFAQDLFCHQGYHRFKCEKLTPDDMLGTMKYAAAAAAAQKNKFNWIEPYGMEVFNLNPALEKELHQHGFEVNKNKLENAQTVEEGYNHSIIHRSTGLKICIFRQKGGGNNSQLLVTFGALGSHKAEFDKVDPTQMRKSSKIERQLFASALSTIVGHLPELVSKANTFVEVLRKYEGDNLKIVGHCLGGCIAQYVSLKQELPGVGINAFPIGQGLQKDIGKKKLSQADQYFKNIIVKNDLFADLPFIVKVIDAVANFFGFRTVGNFGKKYVLPANYDKLLDIHQYAIGSMFAFWKPEHREVARNIAKESDNAGMLMKAFVAVHSYEVTKALALS